MPESRLAKTRQVYQDDDDVDYDTWLRNMTRKYDEAFVAAKSTVAVVHPEYVALTNDAGEVFFDRR